MNKYYFLLLFLALTQVYSQTNAVTEYGDQVILYDDGSWEYVDQELNIDEEISVNPIEFVKPDDSKFLLKSNAFNVGIWLNAKKWKFGKAEDNDEAEYELVLKGEDLYGTVITEKVEIPLEALQEIALLNARDVAPDTKIDFSEFRTVNGLKVLMIEMSGTISGINFAYRGYYYSNENGTIQIIMYTSNSLMKHYDKEVDLLLNGIVGL